MHSNGSRPSSRSRSASAQAKAQRTARLGKRERALPALPSVISVSTLRQNSVLGNTPAVDGSVSSAGQRVNRSGKSESRAVVAAAIRRREALLAQLRAAVERFRECSKEESSASAQSEGRAVLGTLARIRAATLEVVEAIRDWRNAHDRSKALPFNWRGGNYLITMAQDLNFVSETPELVEVLRVEPAKLRQNPLMLPRTLLDALERGPVRSDSQSTNMDSANQSERRRLHEAESIFVQELRSCGLRPDDSASSSSREMYDASQSGSLHVSPSETYALLDWLEQTPPSPAQSLSSMWRTDSPRSLSRGGSCFGKMPATPIQKRRPNTSPSFTQPQTTLILEEFRQEMLSEEDLRAVAEIDLPSPHLAVAAASVLMIMNSTLPSAASDVSWQEFQSRAATGSMAASMQRIIPSAIPQPIISAVLPLIQPLMDSARTADTDMAQVDCASVRRLFDWINEVVQEAQAARSLDFHPASSRASSAKSSMFDGVKSAATPCSQTPIAIRRSRCSAGGPVTVVIFAMRSRSHLRVVAHDDDEFVSAQLVVDVSDSEWERQARPENFRERARLANRTWWTKNLARMVVVDRLAHKTLAVRIDKQLFRQVFRESDSDQS